MTVIVNLVSWGFESLPALSAREPFSVIDAITR